MSVVTTLDGRTIEPPANTPYHVDALALDAVRSLRPRRVLDVGCASGRFAAKMPGVDVVGIELDDRLAALAEQHCSRVISGSVEEAAVVEEARSTGAFDVVLTLDVLEHLVNPVIALERLKTLLDPSGRIVISLPNLLYYRERLNLLRGRFVTSPIGGLYDETHLHFYSKSEVLKLLHRSGLVVETFLGAGRIRPERRIASLAAPARRIYGIAPWTVSRLARRRPELFARSFVVVARPSAQR